MIRNAMELNEQLWDDPFLRAADMVARAVGALGGGLRPTHDSRRAEEVEQLVRRTERLHADLMAASADYRFDASCGRPWRVDVSDFAPVEEPGQTSAERVEERSGRELCPTG